MAKNLFDTQEFLSEKEDSVIFTTDQDQIVYIEIWNEVEKEVQLNISVGKKVYMDNRISICDEKQAHQCHKMILVKGDSIVAYSGIEKAVSYNIIL